MDYLESMNKQTKSSLYLLKTQMDLLENSAITREKMIKDAIDDNLKQKNDLVDTRVTFLAKLEDFK